MFEWIKVVLDIHRRAFLDGPSTEEQIGSLEKSRIDDINIDCHPRNAPRGDLTESGLDLGDTEPRPWLEFEGAEMGEEAPCGGGNQNMPFVSVKERQYYRSKGICLWVWSERRSVDIQPIGSGSGSGSICR
jgi:hypothetical protein